MLAAKKNVCWMRDFVSTKEKITPTFAYVENMKFSVLQETEAKLKELEIQAKSLEKPYQILQQIKDKAELIWRACDGR